MSGTPPEHFALYTLLVGFVLALAVVGVGIGGVVRRALALRVHVERISRLPFEPVLELTQARLAIANRAADRLPRLIERGQLALAQIAAARTSVVTSWREARATVRAFFQPAP